MIDHNSIFRALSDFDNRKIIFSIIEKPKTIQEIIAWTKLPQSTAFLKIKELQKLELIEQVGQSKEDNSGPKSKTYKSKILSARISVYKPHVEVKLIENTEDGKNERMG